MSANVMQAKRICSKCGEAKDPSEFYEQKYGDGLYRQCKDCVRAAAHTYRLANIEKVRAYDRMRGKQPERIRADAEYHRRSYRTDQNTAHRAVYRALRDGRLARPEMCSECGSMGRIEAHHPDYSRPLEIVWLCPVCHSRVGGVND